MASETMKQCPYCQQWIPLRARQCSYCSRLLETSAANAQAIQEQPPPILPPRPAEGSRHPYRPRWEEDARDDEGDDYFPRRRAERRGPHANCPHCGCPGFGHRVTYNWWGGFLGPAILNHVKCDECGKCYNGTTGRDNTAGIIIYSVVCFVIAFAIFFLIASSGGF